MTLQELHPLFKDTTWNITVLFNDDTVTVLIAPRLDDNKYIEPQVCKNTPDKIDADVIAAIELMKNTAPNAVRDIQNLTKSLEEKKSKVGKPDKKKTVAPKKEEGPKLF